jgi:ferredoxin
MINDITVKAINQELTERVLELQAEPEFQKTNGSECAVGSNGVPQMKVAMGNVPLEYDLWEGLRNPAVVGIYPAGLPELWEYYANRRKQKVDDAGRQTIFQSPRSYEFALKNYRRAILISVMLPFSPGIIHDYVSQVIERKNGSSSSFASMYDRLNRMLDKAITRTAINLVTDDSERVVIVMNSDNVKAVATEVIPQTRQGISHGPSKGGNYPQKSLAVLTGLGQFGVSRIVLRDELIDNKVERFAGPIRSIVVFDKQLLVTDGKDGLIYPSPAWRKFLFRLFDFTDTDIDIDSYRFCSHVSLGSQSCNQCIANCPSGAQKSSSPESDGHYSEQVSRQAHRFWDKKLQFDFGKCTDERVQMAGLFTEWSCGRCLAVCLDQGIRLKQAAKSYCDKMAELAR